MKKITISRTGENIVYAFPNDPLSSVKPIQYIHIAFSLLKKCHLQDTWKVEVILLGLGLGLLLLVGNAVIVGIGLYYPFPSR